jgi:protein TonB
VPLTKPAPGYPEPTLRVERSGLSAGARAAAAQGRVRLRVLVRADGGVDRVDVLVSTGSPELDASAVASLSQWRFAPATRDGVAIDAYYSLWISFRLD